MRFWLIGAGLLLLGVALWVRFAWAPRQLGTPAELAANYVRMGSQAAVSGHFTQAVEYFQRAVALNPRSVDAWMALGSARADAEDRAGAFQALAQAEGLAPGRADVSLTRARLYLRFQQYAEARQAADRATQQTPDDSYAWVTAALARAESLSSPGDEAEAERCVRQALEHGFQGSTTSYVRGLIALHAGDPKAAIGPLREAVAREPKQANLRYRLATAYRLAGQQADAERELREFQRLNAGHENSPTAGSSR